LPDKIIVVSRHTVTYFGRKIEDTISSSIARKAVSEGITSQTIINTSSTSFITILEIVLHTGTGGWGD
jgi:hypothetical protein